MVRLEPGMIVRFTGRSAPWNRARAQVFVHQSGGAARIVDPDLGEVRIVKAMELEVRCAGGGGERRRE